MPSSSCGQEDSNCNEGGTEFNEANEESQDCLRDCGQDLMRYSKT